jgi:PAS domain S-box-containing protein
MLTEADVIKILEELELHQIELKMQNEELRKARDLAVFNLQKKTEVDNLNEMLLSSLPHPAMYISIKDRIVLAANKIAMDLGVKPGGYCWREFGKSDYLSEKNKKIVANYIGDVPGEFNIKCTFCQADQCFTSNPEQKNPEVQAFGLVWETYWIKASDDVYLHYAIDVTDLKQTELHRQLGREILLLLNETGTSNQLVRKVLDLVKDTLEFDAVGLRMQEGNDYPYYYSKGFSETFLKLENSLISRNIDGGICRDEKGNISLECTCGLILSGKADPSNPMFTKGGSSWTNNSFPFLDVPASDDPRTNPRNQCIHQGYASVALIPVRAGKKIIGLLQLNDHRKNRFTESAIESLEFIAENIGDALLRKQSEEALIRSDYLLRNTQRLTQSGGWEYDVEKKSMFWTEETYRLHGIDVTDLESGGEQLIQLSLDCYTPEERPVILDAFNRCIEEGLPYELEGPFINRKGEHLWIRTSAEAVVENGKIVRVIGFVSNITKRKLSIDKLFELTQQFRTLAILAPVGIYLTDPEGNCQYANPAWCSMAGLTPDEALGLGWMNGIHLEDREMVFSNWKRMVESNGKWGLEYRFQNKQGKVTHVYSLATPQYDETGRTKCYVGVNLDITERKLSEQILVESELQLRSLVRILQNKTETTQELLDFTLEEAINLTNSKIGYIYFYNDSKKVFTLFSWSKQVMKECTIMNPQTLYNLSETGIWGEAVRQHKPIIVNDFHAHNPLKKGYPEGHAQLHKFLTIPVVIENEIVAVVGVGNKETDYAEKDILNLTILMDSTWKIFQKKNIDAFVKEQNTELLKLNADKDRFMAILAHDLKSPFNALLGLSEVLSANLRTFELDKIEILVGLINKSAKNTYNLLEDLLMWTRSQSGKIPFQPVDNELHNICEDVLEDLKFNADNKQITITNQVSKETHVYADLEMMKTILRNLISNAIKFTLPEGKVYISAERTNQEVCISVSDSGVGIPPEILINLFDISLLNSTKGTANEGGTGLGLMLCKDFVEKHGGKIWAESTEEVGSNFKFTLPIAD